MPEYLIVEDSDNYPSYTPYGAAYDLWHCKAKEVIISGPAECLAGETVLDGTGLTISECVDKKISPTVQTLAGPVRAELPFVKGVGDLYKVTLENGQSFLGTKKHLVLTPLGWSQVGELQRGEYLITNTTKFPTQSIIQHIEFIRRDKFYDLHVPGIEHYFANGVLHHNTGKTRAAIEKLSALLCLFPKSQAIMIRKIYGDMASSCIQTYEKKVLCAWNDELEEFDPALTPIQKYGGERPVFYDYPNGSRLWIAGLDKPGRALSAEYDFAYINQVEELSLNSFEILTTRITGRSGNTPYTQIIGDCNPDHERHWILDRAKENKTVLLHSKHEDNPTLFNPTTGKITEQGKISLAILDNLTGTRKQRLRYGKWVSAEGQIYENWDPAIHLIDRFDIPESWPRYRCIDFGYVNPFVCGWWAVDEDKRLYCYRYIYMTQRTVKAHSEQIKRYSEKVTATICDHDAEDRATLKENGIPNIRANKAAAIGIGQVMDRLKVQPDGKPRLFILKDSLVEVDQRLLADKKIYRGEDEFSAYVWANKVSKEEPVKENDHFLDMVRYMVMHFFEKKPRKFIKV